MSHYFYELILIFWRSKSEDFVGQLNEETQMWGFEDLSEDMKSK